MKVVVAKELGFCFGVKRAYELAISNASSKTAIIGQLVHNQDVQNNLYEHGIKDFDENCNCEKIILRSHGTIKEEKEELSKSYELIDTTCPILLNIYNKMTEKEDEGYTNIIFGDPNHPEVVATKSQVKNCIVIDSPEEVESLKEDLYFVTMQTTLNYDKADLLTKAISDKFGNKVKVFNSICGASSKRRKSLIELMDEVEAIIILGSENSNNTKELCNILKEKNFPYYFANDVFSLDLSSISMYNSIGISAGASTPDWIIKEAVRVLNDINNKDSIDLGENNVASDKIVAKNDPIENHESNKTDANIPSKDTVTDSFNHNEKGESTMINENEKVSTETTENASNNAVNEQDHAEMMAKIDDTFTRIKRGQIVPGTVLYVTESQIMVNINYRSDGIIDRDELPTDLTDPRTEYKAGDEIDVYIVKVDDGEGNVVLSLRRIKDVQAWNELEEKFEAKEPIEVFVKEQTKGGLIVEYKGARAFMPASHSFDRFRRDLSSLVGETVKVEIIDFDKSKRRCVVSRRELEKARIQKEQDEFWSGVEEGQLRKGKVMRLTNFGAFVDLGGVDGLIHITDLAWNRVRDPKEVLSVGDEVEVLVLGFDREKNRISLGLKQTTEDPWEVFKKNNKVGDVVKGTVVSMPEFGAFVRLAEGIDGLIHISQICREHIEKPSDILNMGQEVEAKITDIKDNQKISLSIRALTEPEEEKRERKPRRERAPRKSFDDNRKEEKVDTNPIDNPLIDSEILGELKKMALNLDDNASEGEATENSEE